MTPKLPRLHKSEDARDHRNTAERDHCSPVQSDRANIDNGALAIGPSATASNANRSQTTTRMIGSEVL